jgi:3-dehydro-L-gulonate 2-dehydrogenase
MSEYITVPANEMRERFLAILLRHGLDTSRAAELAEVFTANSIDGVYSHGVNRFAKFIQYVQKGLVVKDAVTTLTNKFNGLEQWNGNYGPGPSNAIHCTNRAMELSKQYGIGCVGLSNNNHWLRAGYYGWQAAKEGFILIAWTNTIACMPAWHAVDPKLGNNPMVLAMPYKDEAIVLDMAMSQYSYGAMQIAASKGENLAVAGGFDAAGNLTNDPVAILSSRRPLPLGYWKGSGMALLLDLLATVLSGGMSTAEITQTGHEFSSHVFVCIDPSKVGTTLISGSVERIVGDYLASKTAQGEKVSYPGERVLQTRNRNLIQGIPVSKTIWEELSAL